MKAVAKILGGMVLCLAGGYVLIFDAYFECVRNLETYLTEIAALIATIGGAMMIHQGCMALRTRYLK